MANKPKHVIRRTFFDSKTVDGNFAAFDAQADCIEFQIVNVTGKELSVRVGASGDTLELANNHKLSLRGDPSGYQVKNNTDSNSITVKLKIKAI